MPGRAGRGDRLDDVAGRVAPAELAELAGVEALGAERDPGDAGVVLRVRIAALVGPRVGLEGHLRRVAQPEPAADPVDDRRQGLGREEGRGSAAEVERPEGRPPAGRPAGSSEPLVEDVGAEVELGQERLDEGRDPVARTARVSDPATTTKSQYGQIDTQKGTWT